MVVSVFFLFYSVFQEQDYVTLYNILLGNT